MSDRATITTTALHKHERLLLACALRDSDIAREAVRAVQAPMTPPTRSLARALVVCAESYAVTRPVDVIDAVAPSCGDDN